MKKIFYSAVVLIAICNSTYAKTISIKIVTENQTQQEKEYKKITPENVSREAIMNIKAKYGDYQITEAAVASDGEYKLTLKKDNGILVTLFTSSGDLVKIL